jgi:hypothetical protein
MYDTMANVIAVNVKHAQGSVKQSTYSTQKSNTSAAIRFPTRIHGQDVLSKVTDSIHFGGKSSLSGDQYTETMCLQRKEVEVSTGVPVVRADSAD